MLRTARSAVAAAALLTLLAGCNEGHVISTGTEPPVTTAGKGSSSGSAASSTSGGASSGSTGTVTDGALCAPCTVDADCGEPGWALCVAQNGGTSGACALACTDDSDCDVNAQCYHYGSTQVCLPTSGTCDGFVPGGPRGGGSDASSSSSSSSSTSGSGSASTTTAGSSTASSSSSGSTGTTSTSSTSSSTSSTSGTTSTSSTSSTTSSSSTTSTSGTTGTTSTSGTTGTGVGLHGGTVDRLNFLITGDTRPPACEDTAHYPTTIISKIADAATAANMQFALDMGDHMFVCNNQPAPAKAQMKLYMQATSRFAGPWFMTEGNHECMGSNSGHCTLTSTNANYLAFMDALSPIASKPYYKRDIQTSQGLATFVFVADNSWTSAQETWLKNTLATADANAKYTIIVKHHPAADTSVSANATIMSIIRNHKFSLLLTGHAHEYRHPSADRGREIVMGLGGAPLTGTSYHGYAIIHQKLDGDLKVTVYSLATGAAQDTWTVPPN